MMSRTGFHAWCKRNNMGLCKAHRRIVVTADTDQLDEVIARSPYKLEQRSEREAVFILERKVTYYPKYFHNFRDRFPALVIEAQPLYTTPYKVMGDELLGPEEYKYTHSYWYITELSTDVNESLLSVPYIKDRDTQKIIAMFLGRVPLGK